MAKERVISVVVAGCLVVVAAVGISMLQGTNQSSAGGQSDGVLESGRQRAIASKPEAVAASQAAVDAARKYLLSGEVGKALILLDRAIEQTPDLQVLHLVASDAHFDNDNLEGAAISMERAIDIGPVHAEMYQAAGLYRSMLGQREDAIGHWQLGEELAPGDPRFGLQTAAVLHGLKRYQEAIAEADRVIALHPEVAQVHAIAAGACVEIGEFVRAVDYARGAVRLDPSNWTFRLLEAQGLLGIDDAEGAVLSLRALNSTTLVSDALLAKTYAASLVQVGRTSEAINVLLQAAAVDTDGALQERAGLLLAEQGEAERASEVAKSLRIIAPTRGQRVLDAIQARTQ